MALAVEGLSHAAAIAEKGNKSSITDAGVGAMHLETALKGAHLNVLINLPGLKDAAYVADCRAKAGKLLEQGRAHALAVEKAVEKGMAA